MLPHEKRQNVSGMSALFPHLKGVFPHLKGVFLSMKGCAIAPTCQNMPITSFSQFESNFHFCNLDFGSGKRYDRLAITGQSRS